MIVLLFVVPVLVAVLLALNILFASHRPDAEKVSSYECGMPIVAAQTRNPFSISFYLVAILFLLFDLEIALVYPVAVSLGVVGSYGFWVAMLFLGLLTVGFVYEWGQGAIQITNHRSDIANVSIVQNNDLIESNFPFVATVVFYL